MKRVSGLSVLVTNMVIFGAVLGVGSIIRSCALSDHKETVESYKASEQHRKDELRIFRVAAGLQEGPETSYYTTVKKLLKDPVVSEKMKEPKLSSFISLMNEMAEAPSWLYTETKPEWAEVTLRFAELRKHTHHDIIESYASSLDEIVTGKKGIPEGLTEPGQPPAPFVYWTLVTIIVYYVIACILAFIAVFVFSGLETETWDLRQTYPWWTIGGVITCMTQLPMFATAGLVALGRIGINHDWKMFVHNTGYSLQWTAYQLRILRKYEMPTVQPALLQEVGMLTRAPAPRQTDVVAREPTRRDRPGDAQWFAFRPSLIRGHHAALNEAGIKPVIIDIQHPNRVHALAVPASSMDQLERLTRLSRSEVSYAETNIRNLYFCSYSFECGRIEVFCEDDHTDRAKNMMQKISAEFGGIDIIFDGNQDCVPRPELRCDGVVVYHCSRPSTALRKSHTKTIFGRERDALIILPVEGKGPLIEDENGTAVAQVVGRNIFTYVYGMLNAKAAWADEALCNVITTGIEMILAGEHEKDAETAEDEWHNGLDAHRKNYVNMAIERYREEERQITEDIAKCLTAVEQGRKTIATSLRLKKNLDHRLVQLREGPLRLREQELVKEFDQLAASPYVIGVRCEEDHIDVYTKTIFILHEGRRYEIGRFRLRMSDNGHIGIHNVDNTCKDTYWHHPHVRDDYTCFGNLEEAIAKYLADRQFAIVVSLLYRFLEQYNPHRGVEDIRNWKEITDA